MKMKRLKPLEGYVGPEDMLIAHNNLVRVINSLVDVIEVLQDRIKDMESYNEPDEMEGGE